MLKKLIGTLIILAGTIPIGLFTYPMAADLWTPIGGFIFAFMPLWFMLLAIRVVFHIVAPKLIDGTIDFFIKREAK